MRLQINKEVTIPDPIKLARYKKSPELGPKILFFSGGTALRALSQELIQYTHNSIHIITPFDSGGSSAELRKAFSMPAVGDIRNRLMALSDQSIKGNPEIVRLFLHRFPKQGDLKTIVQEFDKMVGGSHELIRNIPAPMDTIIGHHLSVFQKTMPSWFDLRGANIGNLVLTAGYLENDRQMDPIIYIYSKLAEIRGTVRPVINMDLHLVTELEDGTVLPGQHLLTGKEVAPIRSRVKKVFLSDDLKSCAPVSIFLQQDIIRLIQEADCICFPMGSFFSSIVAHLLLEGIGQAVSQTRCPKIFVPNTYPDPELFDMSLEDQVEKLVHLLSADLSGVSKQNEVLNYIFLDKDISRYYGEVSRSFFQDLGLQPLCMELVTHKTSPKIDPVRLTRVLLSLT
jgi:CofD-related protein of GAK system